MNTDKGPSGGKRIGDEINHVKERSAESIFRRPGDVCCIISYCYDMSTKSLKK
jgi:hypothetical protein